MSASGDTRHTYGSCLYNILSSRQSGPYSDLPSMHISLPGAHPVFPLTFEHCISYGSSHHLFLQPPTLLNTLPVLKVTSQACGVDGHSGCVSASSCSASCVFAESRKSPGTKGARTGTSVHVDAALLSCWGRVGLLRHSKVPLLLYLSGMVPGRIAPQGCNDVHLVHANGFLIWNPSSPVVSSRVLTCANDHLLLTVSQPSI